VDFYKIRVKETKEGLQVYPDWIVDNTEDLMVRGGAFYAVWDDELGMWSTDEMALREKVDKELYAFADKMQMPSSEKPVSILITRNFSTGSWKRFKDYIRSLPDNINHHQLDTTLTFANTEVSKKDYVSKRLPYSLESGKTDAWDELTGVLYSPTELEKIEWCIGAIVAGDSKWIQKFLVFYGPPASGKSTVIDVIEKLFVGYISTFEAKALTSNNGTFAMEVFEKNPLVAIQHDGDLSRVEDNTRLNSIVGHDTMTMNVKYRSSFDVRPNAFLIVGTNKPVRITDSKAGSVRRLIDVSPTGVMIETNRYHLLVEQINYELGAIAYKCFNQYREMGKYYYSSYIPTKMMALTDHFYNFIEANADIFKSQDAVKMSNAWELYKQYCEHANIVNRMAYHEVKDELGSYFLEFKERHMIDEKEQRSVYVGFKGLPINGPEYFVPDTSYVIELEDYVPGVFDSAFNALCADQPAQYAKDSGYPGQKWIEVDTTLSQLDTTQPHFVKLPINHIVMDFDLVNEDGDKDLSLNIEAASRLPPTYTEISKSGNALHLHYIYQGDVTELASVFDTGVEIKTLLGDASLRRRLTKCNNLDIATISGGLPKKEKKMLETKAVQTEKGIRDLIERNLLKEIHSGTKPSIDFIHHILEEAYDSGIAYNVEDLRPRILSFAASSSNQSGKCINMVQKMKFAGKEPMPEPKDPEDRPLVFFDVEVYPNLLVVCWKSENVDEVVRMVNPETKEIEALLAQRLVGFNNRRYDNHILYARYLGYPLERIYELSQRIIDNGKSNPSILFGEAYNLSYADIYDFSSKKQGLKKFQIELGIHHQELDLPWDEPVDEMHWDKVVEYCVNDVVSTEAVFKSRHSDFVARQILAEISGLSVNHTTQNHTAKILFGGDKNPQGKFVYTDLSEEFPGYRFDGKESWYGDERPSEGGYVYSEPGYYRNVAVLDVASMHPTSIERLNLFGPYTERFSDLKKARMAIKRKDYEAARSMLDGKLSVFLGDAEDDPEGAEALAYALKIVINIVYGLTSARFDNPFRDHRNKDNIVAKRGALFMIDLKHAVQDRGFTVAHIKTDSIKIPNADAEIIQFVIDFGKEYGYDFEHETTYDRFCLVNDAVYIARSGDSWTAVGAQFQHPYVFKELFSHEDLVFDDLCETKNVTKGAMYLDRTGNPEATVEDMQFVGRTGSFMPVRYDGGILWRVNDGRKYHVTGTKGYEWIEREMAKYRDGIINGEDGLFTDMDYFEKLKDDAIRSIEMYVPFKDFVEENS
jgi:hypothetical protein